MITKGKIEGKTRKSISKLELKINMLINHEI